MSKVEFTDTHAGSNSFPGFLTPVKGDFILTPFTQVKSPEIMTEPSFSRFLNSLHPYTKRMGLPFKIYTGTSSTYSVDSRFPLKGAWIQSLVR